VSILNVTLSPMELLDFGHIDLWTANNTQDLVWEPILDWVNEQSRRDVGAETFISDSAAP
jgi:hypothetical protein